MIKILSDTSQNNSYLREIETYVISQFTEVEAGHDLSHIARVYTNAITINKVEKADSFLVEAGALLHDITDDKLFIKEEAEVALHHFLKSINIEDELIFKIIDIIDNVSYSSSLNKQGEELSKEQKIVRDADRLDAIGAIGIARAFQYGGHKNRLLIDLDNPPVSNQSKEEYRNNNGSTINHFYEKLLLLKDKMETATGNKLAKKRHVFMKKFLGQFYDEIGFEGFKIDKL